MAKKKNTDGAQAQAQAKTKVKFSTQDFDGMIYKNCYESAAAKVDNFSLSRPMQDAMRLTLDVDGIARASIWMADHIVNCHDNAPREEEQFSIRLAPAQFDAVILVNIRCSICGEEYTAGAIPCK